MSETGRIFMGAAANAPDSAQYLDLKLANRHGLIAGATGTGKTVTLQGLAEGFSRAGVPVFMADVKGDLSGLSEVGGDKQVFKDRAEQLGLTDFAGAAYPVIFWDVYGVSGHPVRATISEMGPLLLARLFDLNETQSGVLSLVFKVADDEGLLLMDLKDLRALLVYVSENSAKLTATYGNVAAATVGTIQRRLLEVEAQGADKFFGEPALRLDDFMRIDPNGRGTISILAADKLVQAPKLYATLLLWLLSELFEKLPEVGDLDKPRLVFFFDEAHLLFNDAPKALLDKVTQVVRLIRSKGVGVYFVTQSPTDIPDDVLGQLGNRVQHALRAFTPKDAKLVKAAADTFRQNPKLNTQTAITELGVGEALVSTLGKGGVPGMVERVLIAPPTAHVGPSTPESRARIMATSPMRGLYDTLLDRDSAFEMLARRAEATVANASNDHFTIPNSGPTKPTPRPAAPRRSDSMGEAITKSVLRSVGSSLGRAIVRGVLGSIMKK
ncbi:helicase HerA-like domain-containing protein [Govanella unica]|uniref:DUF853 domain-containing protein n=1 Tax=Govanella unica TaxID=2975056 RepID=A0A9X3U017_9PROT|nr:helicase HerA-like domain-containing protein [Govania unica]MDA5194817.1 DUF853 domain-containing protein [Govania unica]